MTLTLHPDCSQVLNLLRNGRGFAVERYVAAKAYLINRHFSASRLNTAVVGVSGGSDSAAVLAILDYARRQPGSPIKHLVAVLAPYLDTVGTTNQDNATARGREVAEAFNAEVVTLDLAGSHAVMKSAADKAVGIDGREWAAGQLVTYLRTPAFYYVVSLQAQENRDAVFVGSTNRDEGGFIGYFGKAGDAMCDIQLISDIHKSEVVQVARYLNVPASVLAAAPAGDIYDGRSDEELIQVPYDFIELYQLFLGLKEDQERTRLLSLLGTEARTQFDGFASRMNEMNRQNAHKYYGNSPAAHFDIYKRAVPGGWRVETIASRAATGSGFVNKIELAPAIIDGIADDRLPFDGSLVKKRPIGDFGESAFLLEGVLSKAECAALLGDLDRQDWTPVGRDGMKADFDPEKDEVGSWRATCFSDRFARALFKRMAAHLPMLRIMQDLTATDWQDQQDDRIWRAYGVSPVMRFIKYTRHGLLVPHYDSTFVRNEDKRTLMSVVLYLTDNDAESGGATRFIKDPQVDVPVTKRNLADWTRLADDAEVLHAVAPSAGSVLVFDHRLLHDSQPIIGDTRKVIMRTDLKFHRGGLLTRRQATEALPLGKA